MKLPVRDPKDKVFPYVPNEGVILALAISPKDGSVELVENHGRGECPERRDYQDIVEMSLEHHYTHPDDDIIMIQVLRHQMRD